MKMGDALVEEGIDFVFGIPGGGALQIYDALYDRQHMIKAILVKNQEIASCMANMYGRLAGKPEGSDQKVISQVKGQGNQKRLVCPLSFKGRVNSLAGELWRILEN